MGLQIFPIKFEGLVKLVELFRGKGVSLIFILTNPLQFSSVICVLQEEPSLMASNQQIYDFYKRIISEKKRHYINKFLMLVNYSFNHLM